MKQKIVPRWPQIPAALALVALAAAAVRPASASEPSLQSAPPVVVKTVPVAGSTGVDPGLTEIRVTYSKPMMDGSWSWSTWGGENELEGTGEPRYLADGRTCVLPVKLQPGKFYATWLNSDKFHNFQDRTGRSAVPYLLTFVTAKGGGGGGGFGGGGRGESGGGGGGGRGADVRLDTAFQAPEPPPVSGLSQAKVLHRDSGIKTGVESINGSGHAVEFSAAQASAAQAFADRYGLRAPESPGDGARPRDTHYVEAVQIFASRYGTPEPPDEDFHLYLLNDRQEVLADVPFPYSLIERGDLKWHTLRTPSIEVPDKFTVALAFNPQRTKGIYLAYSDTSGPTCYSRIGLPDKGFEFWKPVEWMVRPSLTAEPTQAKGLKRLADWVPPGH